MAFYVDELRAVAERERRRCADRWLRRAKSWCRLFADDQAELHDIAEQLGIARSAFVSSAAGVPPFYLLTPPKLRRAHQLGAGRADQRTVERLARRDWAQLPLHDAALAWQQLDPWEQEARIIHGARQEARRRMERDAAVAERRLRGRRVPARVEGPSR